MIDNWRDRLTIIMNEQNISARNLSLKAGLSENFVGQMFRTGRDPSISNIVKICAALNIAPANILFGVRISEQEQQLLTLTSQLSKNSYNIFVELMQSCLALEQNRDLLALLPQLSKRTRAEVYELARSKASAECSDEQ